ncbi:MAG TPA: methyltransferase domain-containing protein [Candidatus Humimicrobiaceae bacterium]
MGDINQLLFIKKNIDKIKGPILEVGSKNYGNTQDLRSLFENVDYIGIDMEDGNGVDIVLDLTKDFNFIEDKLEGKRFQTIVCFSVLEHCSDPFKMCSNIERLLKKNSLVFISVPFSWRIHGYPNDYWRFTPEGIKILFPNLKFDLKEGCLSTGKPGVDRSIDDYMLRVELDLKKARERRIYRNFNLYFLRVLKKLKIIDWISDNSYLFPPVTINMIGRKRA